MPDQTTTSSMDNNRHKSHWLLWLLTIVAAFALGWYLHKCPCQSPSAGGGGGGGGGGGSGAPGSPAKLGAGGGGGGGGGGGSASPGPSTAGSGSLSGGDGNGDAGGGKSPGGGAGDLAGHGAAKGADIDGVTNYARKLATNTAKGWSIEDKTPPTKPTASRSANDFSLDGTGLPRYPNTVRVMSAIAYRTDVTGDSGTVAVMQSNDSFDAAASWYHNHVPAGWKETRLDDMQKVAQQMSPENIGKMLHSFATGVAANADTASPTPTTAPAGPAIAIWSAPDNDSRQSRSVMVTSKPGQPTEVVISRSVKQ